MSEFLFKLGSLFEEYETSQEMQDAKNLVDRPYTISEIEELYPVLSKHIISDAIAKKMLAYEKIGNTRCFRIKDIEDYLELCTIAADPNYIMKSGINNG